MDEMSSDLRFIIQVDMNTTGVSSLSLTLSPQCHGNTKEVGGRESSSENSNSSTLSMENQYQATNRFIFKFRVFKRFGIRKLR